MNFDVFIIGSNSAVQAFGRHPTCQVLNVHSQSYLIDCGEGSQFRLEHFKIKRSKINQIFISHLHGDHYYGLIGFIASLNLNGRKEKLTIFGPEGIKEILDINFFYSKSVLKFQLEIIVVDTEKHALIHEDNIIEVYTIPLQHKIPTTGYLFKEKKGIKNIIKEKITAYNIPFEKIIDIKNGADFIAKNGSIIPNNELTNEARNPRTYAYCSDTIYSESVVPFINKVDLLYHEATYMEQEKEKAAEYFHTTAKQAGMIAKKAAVQQLVIGHFSSRYDDLEKLLEEAKAVFPNSLLAREGQLFSIP